MQLHAAVVELYTAKDAEIKYSTVQNWYAGDENGKGGIYNFVTKRGLCDGANSKISWTQVQRRLCPHCGRAPVPCILGGVRRRCTAKLRCSLRLPGLYPSGACLRLRR